MKKRSVPEIFEETILDLSKNKSLDKITVKMIVEESGLSLQSFYNYYLDKDDLILSIHKKEGDRLIKDFEDEKISLRELIYNNAKFYFDHKNFMLNAIKHTSGQDSYGLTSGKNAYKVLRNHLLKKKNIKTLPRDIDFFLKMSVTANVWIHAYWVENMEDLSLDEFTDLIFEALPVKLRDYMVS